MDKYGLLGERLLHSFSPQIHSCLGSYEYMLYEKTPEEAEDFLINGYYDGLNITIPYKKLAYSCCNRLSKSAKKIGAVNTVVKSHDGLLYGDNTDYFGFMYMLAHLGVDVSDCKAVVLGSGGSSLTVQTVLRDMGVSEIITVSRNGYENYENIDRHYDARIVVNTTPVGMYPNNGEAPVDISRFSQCSAVLDLIYNPYRTKLIMDAEDMNLKCGSGLVMLVAQAVRAYEIFFNTEIDKQVIGTITRKILNQTRNIMLVGMPGCGKTSIGEKLAEKTGREFFDIDALIESRVGKSIPQIFEEDSESAFRRHETELLKEVSAKRGCVIATGGGIVKEQINRGYIRQNSVVIFLDRAVTDLPVNGRPLSIQNGVHRLASERIPLYREWSDMLIEVNGIEKTANEIIDKLGLTIQKD